MDKQIDYANKGFFIHERDEKGKLIPVDWTILGKKVKVIPLMKGELTRYKHTAKDGTTTPEQDQEIINNHVLDKDGKSFNFTKDELENEIPAGYIAGMLEAVLEVSGIKTKTHGAQDFLEEVYKDQPKELKK